MKIGYNEPIPFQENTNIMKKVQAFLLACLIIIGTALLVSACDIHISLNDTIPVTASAASTVVGGKTDQGSAIKFNLNGVAQGYSTLTVEAAPAGADIPSWDNLPAHTVISLNGYVIQYHLHKAHLIIYPINDLEKFNEGAAQKAADLKALLQTKQTGERMPFLPLFNAAQIMHTQVKFLDFANGKGVRFLTQFDQAPLPINNHELFYTFQGLSNDGKFYLAAVLPVTHASLPADEQVNTTDMDAYMSSFRSKMNETIASLEQQPASSFIPDLGKLDAMIQSIEIK